jgi:hydroxymethylpyrimidine/phosphomethylpyrimidine kinase
MTMVPNVLSIAGSDPSGGAGIQADLKAFSAMRVYGMAAVTALTAQNTMGVSAAHMVPPDMVRAQIHDVFADIRVDAVKIGMIGTAEVAAAVADALRPHAGVPVVLDPVMVAKGGDRLLREDAVATLTTRLLPLASVITPNLGEAADLLGGAPIRDRTGMEAAARALLRLGPRAVLLKGGHLGGTESPDLLSTGDGLAWFEGPRRASANTHGTGCTLSSALAALLAHGHPLSDAVAAAKTYVAGAIAAADALGVGHGHGPTHHFHALWR